MIERATGVMDKGGCFSMLLPDLLKTFDGLPHDLIKDLFNIYLFQ